MSSQPDKPHEALLQQVALVQDRLGELHKAASNVCEDHVTGYQSFVQAKYASPYMSRDELLAVETVDLTDQEHKILVDALTVEQREAVKAEQSEREMRLEQRLAELQQELEATRAKSEGLLESMTAEIRTQLEEAHKSNAELSKTLASAHDSKAATEGTEARLRTTLSRQLCLPQVPERVSTKVIMIIGASPLSQLVVELLAEVGLSNFLVANSGTIGDTELSGGLLQAEDGGRSKSEALIQRINDLVLFGDEDRKVSATAIELAPKADELSEVVKNWNPDLLLLLGTPEEVQSCNKACLARSQAWLHASVNGFYWEVNLYSPGDSSCPECYANELDEDTATKDLLEEVADFSHAANMRALGWSVVETTVKYLNGGGPRYCSLVSNNGVISSRDMEPNELCPQPLCQCLQEGLPMVND